MTDERDYQAPDLLNHLCPGLADHLASLQADHVCLLAHHLLDCVPTLLERWEAAQLDRVDEGTIDDITLLRENVAQLCFDLSYHILPVGSHCELYEEDCDTDNPLSHPTEE